MIIRPGTDVDIPAIVQLLRLSLGENLMPKSEAFWRWKHIDNPFGISPVLLAFENGKLIGIRSFMRWEWRGGTRIYKSVRAVDTAVHPEHQGKGIFKSLTQQLVDQCKGEGVDFIFNTPNKSSKLGYLKMGWKEMGRMKIYVRPHLKFTRREADFESKYLLDINQNSLRQPLLFSDKSLITNKSNYFLIWRYQNNPNIRYFSFCDENKSYLVIFRLKHGSIGTEFRICDVFINNEVNLNAFRNRFLHIVGESDASYITFSGAPFPLNAFGLNIGPVVTVRQLSDGDFLSFKYWKPSLGDMEVF